MNDLFASGRVVDLILALLALEAALLGGYRRLTGRGPAVRHLLGNLLAGGCLLLALRAGLQGRHWTVIALWLAAALAAHLLDLYQRWPELANAGGEPAASPAHPRAGE